MIKRKRRWRHNNNGSWSLIEKRITRSSGWLGLSSLKKIRRRTLETIPQEEYFKRKLAGTV